MAGMFMNTLLESSRVENLTSWAETYPLKFCKIIVKLIIPNGPAPQLRSF